LTKSNNISELTSAIRSEAIRLGFLDCGFSKVRELEEIKPIYTGWLSSGFNASMEYMERNIDKRLNPALLVENSKTVISLLYNYYAKDQFAGAPYKISRYAYGADYHDVIKEKLKQLDTFIRTQVGNVDQRYFVDSAPVFEKAWAQQSGLGWIGKNSCLLSRKHGSFFFISEIITSLDLQFDEPVKDYCGTCNKCIEACPTIAIKPGRIIDSNKCISYQTIENKGEIPDTLKGKFKGFVFGCDICQDVCPWNNKAGIHNEPLFILKKEIKNLTPWQWENLDEVTFRELFRKSAIKRVKFFGLSRNISFQIDDLNHLKE
jgi:epoxyqueuosine reductase